jgi:hypothetical protein
MPDQPTIVAAIVTSTQGVLLARRHDGKPTAVRVGDSDEHSEVGWYPWATAEGMLSHLFEPVADHLRATLPA